MLSEIYTPSIMYNFRLDSNPDLRLGDVTTLNWTVVEVQVSQLFSIGSFLLVCYSRLKSALCHFFSLIKEIIPCIISPSLKKFSFKFSARWTAVSAQFFPLHCTSYSSVHFERGDLRWVQTHTVKET